MYTILLCKVTIFAFNCKMKATIFFYIVAEVSGLCSTKYAAIYQYLFCW